MKNRKVYLENLSVYEQRRIFDRGIGKTTGAAFAILSDAILFPNTWRPIVDFTESPKQTGFSPHAANLFRARIMEIIQDCKLEGFEFNKDSVMFNLAQFQPERAVR